jgi:hypothetical protein
MPSPLRRMAAASATSLALGVATMPTLAWSADFGGHGKARHICTEGLCGSPPPPCNGLPATSRCYAYYVAHTQICRRFIPTFDEWGGCLGWRAVFVC